MTDQTADSPAEWIAAGRALADAATGGRWIYAQERRAIWCTDEDGNMIQPILTVRSAEEDGDWISDARTRLPAALDALDAVLALHRRLSYDADCPAICEVCDERDDEWPCPTVRAITAALTAGGS